MTIHCCSPQSLCDDKYPWRCAPLSGRAPLREAGESPLALKTRRSSFGLTHVCGFLQQYELVIIFFCVLPVFSQLPKAGTVPVT